MCWFVSIFIGCLVLFPGSSGSVGCDRPCWLRSHSNLGTSVPFLHRWERPQPVGWGDWGFTWRFTSFAQVLPVMAVYPWLENSNLFGSRHIKLWANYDDLIIFTSRSLWVAQQKLTVKEDVLPKNAWREAKRVVSDEFISQLYPYWFIWLKYIFTYQSLHRSLELFSSWEWKELKENEVSTGCIYHHCRHPNWLHPQLFDFVGICINSCL